MRNIIKLFVIFTGSILLYSFVDDDLELEIKFEAPESLYKIMFDSAVEKGIYKKKYGDFQDVCFTKKYKLGDKDYEFDLYLNSNSKVSSGALRSYSYDIGTTPSKLFLSDSKFISTLSSVRGISVIDFEAIKKYLDVKYGPGKEEIVKTEGNAFFPSQTFYYSKYSNKDFNISLYHSEEARLSPSEKNKIKIVTPFYIGAQIDFNSTQFKKLEKQELEYRIKSLKPKDVLYISWEDPYLKSDKSGGEVVFRVNNEKYICNFLHKKIIQCKGDFSVKDAYGEVIYSEEIDYIFSSPLTPPGEVGVWSQPQIFSLTGKSMEVKKMRELIKKRARLKIEFDIQAIAFEDGTIIKNY